jgi:hypothetical protein
MVPPLPQPLPLPGSVPSADSRACAVGSGHLGFVYLLGGHDSARDETDTVACWDVAARSASTDRAKFCPFLTLPDRMPTKSAMATAVLLPPEWALPQAFGPRQGAGSGAGSAADDRKSAATTVATGAASAASSADVLGGRGHPRIGAVMVAGGRTPREADNSEGTSDVWLCRGPLFAEWERGPSLRLPRVHMSLVVMGSAVLAVGGNVALDSKLPDPSAMPGEGEGEPLVPTRSVERLDWGTGRWEYVASMPVPREAFGAWVV